MEIEQLTDTDGLVIRRMILNPNEAMYWHTDACRRFSVVVRGSRLAIEYKSSGKTVEFEVHPGMASWDEPDNRIHRAINKGDEIYEEVVTFYRTSPDVDPQPRA